MLFDKGRLKKGELDKIVRMRHVRRSPEVLKLRTIAGNIVCRDEKKSKFQNFTE
jgi:hypothetical protein